MVGTIVECGGALVGGVVKGGVGYLFSRCITEMASRYIAIDPNAPLQGGRNWCALITKSIGNSCINCGQIWTTAGCFGAGLLRGRSFSRIENMEEPCMFFAYMGLAATITGIVLCAVVHR